MYKKIFLMLAITLLFGFNLFAAPKDFKEGFWEVSVKMTATGINMPETKYTICLKKDNYIPTEPADKDKQNCKTYDIKVQGNTVYWKMECKTDGVVTKGSGEMTYKGNTFEGKTTIEQPGMKFIQIMKGKWIGECKK